MTMQIPPQNAPPGLPPTLGIQPGQNPAVIIGSIVIVFGNPNGIFIYNGQPTKGNLIGSWAAAAGVDQFGNVYTNGIALGEVSNTEFQLRPDLNAFLIYQE